MNSEKAMTMPNERTRAVLRTRDFLWQLAHATSQEGLRPELRERAKVLLRHYPAKVHMDIVHNACPEWFGPPEPSVSTDCRSCR